MDTHSLTCETQGLEFCRLSRPIDLVRARVPDLPAHARTFPLTALLLLTARARLLRPPCMQAFSQRGPNVVNPVRTVVPVDSANGFLGCMPALCPFGGAGKSRGRARILWVHSSKSECGLRGAGLLLRSSPLLHPCLPRSLAPNVTKPNVPLFCRGAGREARVFLPREQAARSNPSRHCDGV